MVFEARNLEHVCVAHINVLHIFTCVHSEKRRVCGARSRGARATIFGNTSHIEYYVMDKYDVRARKCDAKR